MLRLCSYAYMYVRMPAPASVCTRECVCTLCLWNSDKNTQGQIRRAEGELFSCLKMCCLFNRTPLLLPKIWKDREEKRRIWRKSTDLAGGGKMTGSRSSEINPDVTVRGEGGKHTVHWFRKGLRLHDNPSLREGLTGATTFRCVFVLDPWFAGSTNVGINKWRWVRELTFNKYSSLYNSVFPQVLATVFGRSRLLLAKIELQTIRDKRSAGGRSAEIVQGMGYHEFDLRGRSRAIRTRARPQHLGTLQGAWYLGGPKGLAYSLQVGRVSGNTIIRSTFHS